MIALIVTNIIMMMYLFQKENITKYDLIIILLLFTFYIISNTFLNEQFDTTSNEAVQTLAGMYTNGTLTVPSLNLTGDLSVTGKIKCTTRIDSPIFNTGNYNMTEIIRGGQPEWRLVENDNGLALLVATNGIGSGDGNGWPAIATPKGFVNAFNLNKNGPIITDKSLFNYITI